jgi:hypothetical protein
MSIEERMEDAPSSAAPLRARIGGRKLIAILTAVAVAVGAFVTWEIVRPRSIADVFAMDHLQAGTRIDVQGTITQIGRETTTYGPRTYLQLDQNTFCAGTQPWTGDVVVDPNGSYQSEDVYHGTLHLQSSSINGDPAVSAPELACPFPALFRAIGVVFDGIATVAGIALAFNGTDAGGWTHYEIFTNGTGSRPDSLPATLLKAGPFPRTNPGLPPGGLIDSASRWQLAASLIYLGATAALAGPAAQFTVADRMSSLAAGNSTNGTLRFLDVNGDGLVDNGDRLDVRLPPTTGWETYLLEIGSVGGMAPTHPAGVHFILDGPSGPLEVPLASRTIPLLNLVHAGSLGGLTGADSTTTRTSRREISNDSRRFAYFRPIPFLDVFFGSEDA